MITKTKAYTSSDGQVHATLEAAQRAELTAIFAVEDGHTPLTTVETVHELLTNADRIKDILTTCTRSRPGARAINGATRTRKPAKPPVAKPTRTAHVAENYAKMRAEVDAAAARACRDLTP